MSRIRTTRTSRSRDERGSVLPLVSLAIVTLMTCAAMAVDIGSLAAKNRRLQGVADLAAIAGSAELAGAACNHKYELDGEGESTVFNHVRAAAVANAATNSFPIGGDKSLVVEVGTTTYPSGVPTFAPIWSSAAGTDCTSSAVPTAVRVTAGDYTKFAFGPVVGQKGRTSQRSGVAGRNNDGGEIGGFTIGSSVATLDTSSSPILSSVLSGMVCTGFGGCSISTTLVGWQGLAAANVTLEDLRLALNVGSVNALLNTSLTARQFYVIAAKALGCTAMAGCPNTAAVTLLGMADTTVTSSATFKLRDLITVVSGGEDAAAATSFDVFGLVTGSAEVINGERTISIPVTTVTIPGVTSTTMSVAVTEKPRTYIGPVGGTVETSQVDITVNQQVNLTGLIVSSLATVSGTLPTTVEAGSAKGTLTQVNCGAEKGETVSVDTTGALTKVGTAASAGNLLDVKLGVLFPVTLGTLSLSGTSSVAGVAGIPLNFSYPDEYLPATTAPTHLGGSTLNLQGMTITSSLNAVGLSLNATALTTALLGPTGILTLLDTAIVSPVMQALGVDVAGADVWAIGEPTCKAPGLG